MPNVLFIGGDLDGTLGDDSTPGSCSGSITLQGKNSSATYHIANGIARHESVSEEEVARRVHRWMATWRSEPIPDRVRDAIAENDSAEFYRTMRPQFPIGE